MELSSKEFLKTTKYLTKFFKRNKVKFDVEINPHCNLHTIYFYFNNKSFKVLWDGDVFRFTDYNKSGAENIYRIAQRDQFYIIEDKIIDYINNLLIQDK